MLSVPQSSITEGHSYFVIETVTEPTSGTFTLAVFGLESPGTRAAAWYFGNAMLPVRDTLTKSWYVYEWRDQDADLAPDTNEFTLIASGP